LEKLGFASSKSNQSKGKIINSEVNHKSHKYKSDVLIGSE